MCKTEENLLFFENSYENYNGGTVSIEGIAASTTVNDGGSLPSSTITLSNATTSFIPAQTKVTFSYSDAADTDGIIQNDVEEGATSITLTAACPDPGENTLNIVIKPFNTSTTTVTKETYSERIVNYTITTTDIILPQTTIDGVNGSTITLNNPLQQRIEVGETLFIGTNPYSVDSSKDIGETTLTVSYIGNEVSNPSISEQENVFFRSLKGETLITTGDFRKGSKKSKTIKKLEKQEEGTLFYISTQNKEHENGVIYGDRIGRMLDDRKLNVYHREKDGFYNGWRIYLWNKKITLDKNLTSNIKAGTTVTFKNPLDENDTLDRVLEVDATTALQDTLTIQNIPEKNLDGYMVTIKDFPDGTKISSHDSVNRDIITLTNAVDGTLPENSRLLLTSPDEQTKYYHYSAISVPAGSPQQFTLSPTIGSLDLTNYTVKIMGIPDNTTVSLPSGIIEGYSSRTNSIEVLLNKKTYTLDSDTIYCLKKGYKTTNDGESYFVNLDGNKILHDDYYNNYRFKTL